MKTAVSKPRFTLLFIFRFSFFVFHCSLFTIHSSLSHAQTPTVQDCLGAIPICHLEFTEFESYSGSGNYPNEIYNPPGDCTQDCPGACISGEMNSVWYVFTVQNDGYLRFSIDPAGDDDYDWAVYDLTEYECSDIYSDNDLVQKSCNGYGNSLYDSTGISTAKGGTTDCNDCGWSGSNPWNADLYVTEGSVYVLIVENWGGSAQGFAIDFSPSSASVFDTRPPELDTVFTSGLSCGAMEITFRFSERVMCETVGFPDFQLNGPGGPYNILDVQGETCLKGGEMERQYKLILGQPLVSNGEYSLQLVPGNNVRDGCNNLAITDTIVFNLDLGAPVVIDTGIVITPASYGINDGQITGLIVNGNEPLSYRWYDHFNDTVGTNLDLLDVYSGNYFLEITDTNGCETMAGPYFVDLVEHIADAEESQTGISVFPNPNPGVFTIQVSKDVARISVLNMMGTVIHTFGKEKIIGGTIQADLQQNGPGIYLIQATTDSGRVLIELVEVL